MEENEDKIGSNESSEKFEKAREDMKSVPSTIWKYIASIFSFSNDKDVNSLEVIDNIKADIEFKGPNVWILICSIVICSIGLHLNSIPVIVGAMLISPLMGPIRGIGLAVGTNDFKLLMYSLMNFGVATVVSIVASYLYFKIMPFKDVTPEITSRVQPLILDVLVAFFGGLAGIIAASRNNISTVVPGVAIATALMPPLCVAGYGLATETWNFFFGSFYLFVLNSVFICVATIVVVRYLRFPLATYINKKRERNIKIYIGIFLLLILVPSGIKFVDVFKESVFRNSAQTFLKEELKSIKDISVLREDINYEEKTITVFLGVNDNISARALDQLQQDMESDRFSLEGAVLRVEQNEDLNNGFTMEDARYMLDDLRDKIIEKNILINSLKTENNSSNNFKYDPNEIEKKLKFEKEFEKLSSFSASNSFKVNMNGTCDTTLLFIVNWNDTIISKTRTTRLEDWIKLNFKCDKFEVIEKIK